MTTFYPSQPTPSFLKKYAQNAYNRVHHEAHNGNSGSDEASLALQVRTRYFPMKGVHRACKSKYRLFDSTM